jgi:hypothetical protein
MFDILYTLSPKNLTINFSRLFLVLVTFFLVGCSSVNIIKPVDGAIFISGQPVDFEGEITRSIETGGADRSDDLSWTSSIDGHIGDGRSLTINTLSNGSHRVTASWPNHNRSDSISIQLNP